MNDDIKVTVWCLAYNHEKYIRKTLEGFVSQKTNFKYEVIVHDDASTDKTPDIIREYEEKYPNIIKPIYQMENQYQKGINKTENFLLPNANGKYIAYCEGDDYWCSPEKLQKQFDIMEKNKQCSICFHKTDIILENGNYSNDYFPRYKNLKTGLIESEECLSLIVFTRTLLYLQFQLSSVLLKKENLINYINNKPKFSEISDVGDLPLFLYMLTLGDAFFINDSMSCYRSNSVGSWNMRNNNSFKRVAHLNLECKVLEEFDKYSNYIVHDSIVKGIQNRKFGIYRINHDLKSMKKIKEIYNMLSFKSKFKEHIMYYFLCIYDIWKIIKERLCVK